MQSSVETGTAAQSVAKVAAQQGSPALSAIVHWVDRWQWELTFGLFALCGIIILQTVWQLRRKEGPIAIVRRKTRSATYGQKPIRQGPSPTSEGN